MRLFSTGRFTRRDLYQLLNLTPQATGEQIKASYRTLALRYHPDRTGEYLKFLGVKEAYEVLSDAETRRSYDDWLGVPQGKRHTELVDELFVDAKREWEQEMARQRIQRRVDEEKYRRERAEKEVAERERRERQEMEAAREEQRRRERERWAKVRDIEVKERQRREKEMMEEAKRVQKTNEV